MFTSGLSLRAWVVLGALFALCYSRPALAQDNDPFAPGESQGANTCASCSNRVEPVAVESPRASAARKAIRAALDKSTDLVFIEQPLVEVLAFIGEEHGIQTFIDKRALDDLGLATDTPITIELSNISLRAGLEYMLHDLDLTFVVFRETLFITTVDAVLDSSRYHTVKVYPVSGLLRRAEDGSLEYDVLADTITTVIEPDSWRSAGGTGDIKTIAGTLVVTQTERTHEKIEQLLGILRHVGEPELSPRPKPEPTPGTGGSSREASAKE